MPDISPHTASLIHTIASVTAIIAALISASAVIVAHMASEVQSRHAEKSTAQASQAIAEAHDTAALSRLESEALRQQTVEMAARLEAEKEERLRVVASLQPRKLTEQTQTAFKTLASELAEQKIKPAVLLTIVKNDAEALQYAKQIAVALTKAGVQVQIKQLALLKDISGTQVVLYSGAGNQAIERAFKTAEGAFQISRSSQNPRVTLDDQDSTIISALISVYPKN
ncbi:hypothetical protein [Pseudomonas sp. BP8]|uniref:hypothetical protein n=1 Tax=Pseudomonas sp. BP8 TaxID=2817864 RepID=UPI001AEA0F23|nr:hypothetical protein [Pseudomonas sp. BP8]MBP2262619.1 hypothetical protein [Pseudomonas sp. BP8]HDS1734662.1 hypothetical protein [Pseudomonas putida]